MAEPAQPSALHPDTALLEYVIKSVVGADGFGITYRAEDTILHREVAIKEYFPSGLAARAPDGNVAPVSDSTESNYRKGLQQFLVEARTLARFVHPNIVRVDRYFEANGTAYMLREFEKGESLAQKFARGPRPDEPRLMSILAPLLDGLQAVHQAGVLHRDIKPGNIFIRDEGPPVLIDFGAARLASRDAIQDIIPILTPGYAPVEQYIRSGGQGPWSDIYSLAAVIFWAMTGEHPPDALSRLRMDSVGGMLHAARSRYSTPFIAAIQWGLTVEESGRPQNVDQWRAALLRRTPVPGAAESEPKAPPDDTRKYVWVALGILIFFLFVAGNDIVKERAAQIRALKNAMLPGERPIGGRGPAAAADAPRASVPTPGAGLTPEEFARSVPHLAAKFSEIDADGSGLITSEELQKYLRRGAPASGKK